MALRSGMRSAAGHLNHWREMTEMGSKSFSTLVREHFPCGRTPIGSPLRWESDGSIGGWQGIFQAAQRLKDDLTNAGGLYED
jgi:hypothetical protein